MGSKVFPYFILTAEKVIDRKEHGDPEQERVLNTFRQTPNSPPITPVPSGASNPTDDLVYNLGKQRKKKKGLLRYKIPIRSLKKRSSLTTRMELIKEKLEKSRERFKQKTDQSILNYSGDNGVPTVIGLTGDNDVPYGLDRSVSDLTGAKTKKNADGTFPYVYFVVSDKKDENDEGEQEPEKPKSKSADKKRRVRIVEQNKQKKDKKDQIVKMQGLARELGLKSAIEPKPPDSKPKTQASVNQIVFPDTVPEHPKATRGNDLPSNKGHLHGILHHSPTRVPPSTPATFLSDGKNGGNLASDVDDTVPRKPFLSGPLYTGKNRGLHSCSLQNFELPNISTEQKRRALGLGSSTRFDEFAYPKPKPESRDRKVCFSDQLPVIRGSGFAHGDLDPLADPADALPSLGPRGVTMSSITLPSERVDKQALCQRFLLGENVASARTMRRNGIPMPLPKIDIVSNVYDEMIIKMIQEYLQVSNTPTRQSQLAKELLVHLQKHNETMKEINVPIVKVKSESLIRAEQESLMNLHKKARHAILKEMEVGTPPNTAEVESRIPKSLTPALQSQPNNPVEDGLKEDIDEEEKDEEKDKVPFVEITFKNKTGTENEDGENRENQLPRSAMSGRSLKSRERPIMSPITPVAFQMAPPGLSREDTNLSLHSNS